MPLLAYFTVVGAFLTGLLFAADAYLPKTAPAITSSSFSGLPAAWKGPAQPQLSVSTPAPEPDMNSAAVRAAAPAPVQTAKAEAAGIEVAHADAPAPIKRKKPKPQPEQDWQNHFASGWGQPQFGWGQGGQNNRQPAARPIDSRRAQHPQNTIWR